MTDLTPNDLSHLSDEEFNALCPQGEHAPGPEPPPTNGPNNSDVTELFYRHMGEGSEGGFENAIAEVLTRWGHPATPPPEPPSEKEIEQFVESIRMPWIIEHLSRTTDPDPDFDVVIVRAALHRWGHG